MEQRATVFVEAMIVLAVIGVLAFLISLLARAPLGQRAAANNSEQQAAAPRWYEFTLAVILLAAVAAFAIWIVSSGTRWVWGETIQDWRSDTRTIVFGAIMVALAVVGLMVSLVYALTQSARSAGQVRRPPEILAESEAAAGIAAPPVSSAASPWRVLGLLALVLAVLLLCWIALPDAAQYTLIGQLIYPASLGTAMVLLFDKATRTWATKGGAELLREWLLCDLLVFLLIIAFLNLHRVAKPESYAAGFWDILNLILFFVAFWALDRGRARGRFLVGYGYLVLLPLLLLVWQTVQGSAEPATWWASAWPFLILSAVFFVLEIVTLLSASAEQQVLPAIKDAVFTAAYAVLLIVAIKA